MEQSQFQFPVQARDQRQTMLTGQLNGVLRPARMPHRAPRAQVGTVGSPFRRLMRQLHVSVDAAITAPRDWALPRRRQSGAFSLQVAQQEASRRLAARGS